MPDEQNQAEQPEPAGGPTPEQAPLIFGKYRTMEEAEAGVREQANGLSRIQHTLDAMANRQAQLEQAIYRQATPEPMPFKELEPLGVKPEVLDQYLDRRIAQQVSQGIAQALTPMTQGWRARGEVAGQYKDFGQVEGDVAAYIQSDPALAESYNRMFQADPRAAMEWSYLRYQSARGSRPRQSAAAPPAAGQIPAPAAGSAPRGKDGEADWQQEMQKRREDYDRGLDPDARKLVHARLSGLIPDKHFEPQ